MKVLQVNRKAYRDYEILEKIEAGIKLQGFEVKALKEGRGNLKGSYIKFMTGKPFLVGFNLPNYSKASDQFHYDPTRNRSLLLNTREIKSLQSQTAQKGFTVVPLKIYATERGYLKVLIGLAKGKQKHQLKSDLIRKQQEKDTRQMLKNYRH